MFAVMPFYWLGLQQQCLPQLTPCSQRSALAGSHRKKVFWFPGRMTGVERNEKDDIQSLNFSNT